MGYDLKYGRVTLERSTVADDEPVVVFRARDRLLPELLSRYHALCAAAGSPPHHLAAVERSRDTVAAWQADHPGDVRVPTSSSLAPPPAPAPPTSGGEAAPTPHPPRDGA